MRLLILEDSETDQVLMQAAIARYATSCSVTFVSKLGDVEQYVDGADVVVVDLMLEDSSPEQTIAWIAKCEKPVVVYSGSTDPELIRQCAEAGALNFITKRCPLEQLLAGVEFAFHESEIQNGLRLKRREKLSALMEVIKTFREGKT